MTPESCLICQRCAHMFTTEGVPPQLKACPKCGSARVCSAISPAGHKVMVRVDYSTLCGFGIGAVAGGASDGLDGFMMLLRHTHPDRVHPFPEQTIFMPQEEAIKLRNALNGFYPPEDVYPTGLNDET